MSRFRLLSVAVAASAAFVTCAPQAPKPADLLRRVAETYKNAATYWVEASMHAEQSQQGQKQELDATLRLAGDTLGHMRVQMNAPAAQAWLVANGTDLWVFQSGMGQSQYAQLASAATDSLLRRQMLERLLQAQFPTLPIARYREVDVLSDSATLLREEKLTVDGKEVDCYVVRAVSPAPSPSAPGMPATPVTLWIDKERHVVWREEREASMSDPQAGARSIKERIDFQRVRINDALPDSLFAFTPPTGAVMIPVPPPQRQ
jgi:outer membrane lipoprotein-sorting protein